jgi:hypothetical protein
LTFVSLAKVEHFARAGPPTKVSKSVNVVQPTTTVQLSQFTRRHAHWANFQAKVPAILVTASVLLAAAVKTPFQQTLVACVHMAFLLPVTATLSAKLALISKTLLRQQQQVFTTAHV